MFDERLVLRLCGLQRSEARELADIVGAEASILSEEPPQSAATATVGGDPLR